MVVEEDFALRTLTIRRSAKAFEPSSESPDGGLGVSLTEYGRRKFHTDALTLVALAPSSGHHPKLGQHDVLWSVGTPQWQSRDNQRLIVTTTWPDLIGQKPYLEKLDRWAQRKRRKYPDSLLYTMMGHGENKPKPEDPVQLNHLIASQKPPHFHHMRTLLPSEHPNDRWIYPTEPGFKKTVEIQSDQARQHTQEKLADLMVGFGKPISIVNTIGRNGEIQLDRTVFGFDNLPDAVAATYALITNPKILARWPQVVREIATETNALSTVLPYDIRLRQTFLPTAMIIMPSETMKRNLKTTDPSRVWSLPFSPYGTFSYFIPGGVRLLRP